MEGFKHICNGPGNGIDNCTHLECETCGARVERGIENVADHFSKCFGKDDLIKSRLENELKGMHKKLNPGQYPNE